MRSASFRVSFFWRRHEAPSQIDRAQAAGAEQEFQPATQRADGVDVWLGAQHHHVGWPVSVHGRPRSSTRGADLRDKNHLR